MKSAAELMLPICKMLVLAHKTSVVNGSWVSLLFFHPKIRTSALSGTSSQITTFLFIPLHIKKGIKGQSRSVVIPDFALEFIAIYCRLTHLK